MKPAPPSLSAANRPRLMDHSERLAAYGSPARLDITGKLAPDPAWERASIVTIMVPWSTSDSRWGLQRPLRVHKTVAGQFQELFAAWKDASLLNRLQTSGGAHCTRMKRGKELSKNLADLSTHSFGAAVDLNVMWNPLGAAPAPAGAKGSLVELVPIAEALGWVWGGHWSRPDGMHFEVGVKRF